MNPSREYAWEASRGKSAGVGFAVTYAGLPLISVRTEAATVKLIEDHLTWRMREVLRDCYGRLKFFWIHYSLLDMGSTQQAEQSLRAIEERFGLSFPVELNEELISFPLHHLRAELLKRLTHSSAYLS